MKRSKQARATTRGSKLGHTTNVCSTTRGSELWGSTTRGSFPASTAAPPRRGQTSRQFLQRAGAGQASSSCPLLIHWSARSKLGSESAWTPSFKQIDRFGIRICGRTKTIATWDLNLPATPNVSKTDLTWDLVYWRLPNFQRSIATLGSESCPHCCPGSTEVILHQLVGLADQPTAHVASRCWLVSGPTIGA